MIFPINYLAEWDVINKRKQKRINESNARENSKRVDWDQKIGDLVLVTDNYIQRKLDYQYKGPYKIIQVHSNGNVHIQNGAVTERINIRRCIPYHS